MPTWWTRLKDDMVTKRLPIADIDGQRTTYIADNKQLPTNR